MYDYRCNALPSPPDDRDYAVMVRRPVALPRTYMQAISAPYDQEAGNCVAQTFRNIFRAINGREYGVNLMYGGYRTHSGAGLYPNVAANGACKTGIALLKDDPGEYEVPDVISYYNKHADKLLAAAEPYSGCTWGRATTADGIKQALYSGLYVAGCFAISQWDPGAGYVWPCTAPSYGYHEMRIYGWDVYNGTEYACVQNSWGRQWGNRGCALVSWEDVLRSKDVIALTPKTPKPDDKDDTIIRPTLRKGSTGEWVVVLQKELLAKNFSVGEADGAFGSKTYKAVKTFQRTAGLKPDGICGRMTWEALDG